MFAQAAKGCSAVSDVSLTRAAKKSENSLQISVINNRAPRRRLAVMCRVGMENIIRGIHLNMFAIGRKFGSYCDCIVLRDLGGCEKKDLGSVLGIHVEYLMRLFNKTLILIWKYLFETCQRTL